MEFNKYNKIYIISPNKHLNDYNSFINKLQNLNIINDKKQWNTDNTCLIYNCPSLQKNKNHNFENLEKIINRYKKLKMNETSRNNKIILLYHKSRSDIIDPIKIGDVYIVHNSYLKNSLKNSNAKLNNLNMDNIDGYLEKFTNYLILKDTDNPNISKVRNEDKINNIYHLNKIDVVYDYLNGKNKIINIDLNKDKTNDVIKIIGGNQIIKL